MLSPMHETLFHSTVDSWFRSTFRSPTPVQMRAWRAIAAHRNTLISAPTGSGKTLAAFLAVIDELVRAALQGSLPNATQVLYVSPLKALSNDIQKNLEEPLQGIRRALAGEMLGDAPIRAAVRTGDTPQSERARMRRTPPHILVTTPESLYILLTSESGRAMLSTVKTVIVDEIHAVAGTKRGAHLSLSLERLTALCAAPPVRVGISATSKPMTRIANFLTGTHDTDCEIIDEGHVRERDVALELPNSPLEAVMSNDVWTEIYDRLAELVAQHKTTLVFVNTRRLAERAARHLAERIGEEHVTSHHGSLAKEHRLNAEQRLKAGKLKALVATASLELGIDIGDVDLVCQLGSPHAIATFLQRVGRSGHGVARLPKGRLFPLSRDELVESVALINSVRRNELDAVRVCDAPLDVLAQQIVAEVSMREWSVDELYESFRSAMNYSETSRETFDAVIEMLVRGFTTHRGRRSAHLHHDRVNGVIKGRRGARLVSITNGGAIPDQFDYEVVLLPNEFPIGSLNEDFAFESMPGDIFQLGNTAYRIARIKSGKVYVEDARGQPPSIPFWFGEAPGRTDELSASVCALRADIDTALETQNPAMLSRRLEAELGLDRSAAEQLIEYLAAAKAALGNLPTSERIIFERFFDEAGDTHLVVHSPLGSRINRAWGLSLRKKFCRRFNFELQAAALEDSIVLSLGAVHSFALEEVVTYLSSKRVREVLEQAVLGAPLFPTYWRWNATIALAVRRFRNGKKAPAQFQRIDSEDLLATVFPEQLACAENLGGGDREIPDHPLVSQTLKDCLCSAMDVEGLESLLTRIEAGEVEVLCRDLTTPSPLAQEILAAKAYAFLDDAPAEERRTLAVQSRRFMTLDEAAELGRLDPDAIERVRKEAWPDAINADELHDALVMLGFITAEEASRTPHWQSCFETLVAGGRATRLQLPSGRVLWVSTERVAELELACPQGTVLQRVARLECPVNDEAEALREIVRSRLEGSGPVRAAELARMLDLPQNHIDFALLALENEGFAMRGAYSGTSADEWCERRLLARINRYTLKRLRSEIEPVSLSQYQSFLFKWQGIGAHRREGLIALGSVLSELQGLPLPAAVWERSVLPARIAGFSGDMLDSLCISGEVLWWRPRTARSAQVIRVNTVAASPIAIVPRSAAGAWRGLSARVDDLSDLGDCGSQAAKVLEILTTQGASFFVDLVTASGLLRTQVEVALGELVARGLVTSDSFAGLRALLKPQSRRRSGRRGYPRRELASPFDAAGRWALVSRQNRVDDEHVRREAVQTAALTLLRRYGVITRAVLERETMAPTWRELVGYYRRAEARGEIRGGRFIEPLSGEQYALRDAVDELRRVRREAAGDDWTVVSAADPANLSSLAGQAPKVPAIASNRIAFKNGVGVAALVGNDVLFRTEIGTTDAARARALLLPQRGLSHRVGPTAGLDSLPPGRSA